MLVIKIEQISNELMDILIKETSLKLGSVQTQPNIRFWDMYLEPPIAKQCYLTVKTWNKLVVNMFLIFSTIVVCAIL